jgi:hypothetical protein
LREREREREREGEDLMKNLRSGNPNGEGRREYLSWMMTKKSLYLVD